MAGARDSLNQRYNDVLKSEDNAITWTQVDSTPFTPVRSEQQSFEVSGNFFVIGVYGGSRLNDIWRSTNQGVTWTAVTVSGNHFSTRRDHSAVVDTSGNIYIMGGRDNPSNITQDDVWKSSDQGVTWTQIASSNNTFTGVEDHESVIDSQGRIYIVGGWNTNNQNDIWRSDDNGVTWTQVATTKFTNRRDHTVVIDSSDNIYAIGGYADTNRNVGTGVNASDFNNDVWKSSDAGVTWTQVASGTRFSAREGHASFVDSGDNIYVIGGSDLNQESQNDMWKALILV